MVDDEIALTFSIRNNPGVYALLLGSGVSAEAEIPTGRGVVEDLIKKLATIEDEDPSPDPFKWYEKTYKKEPKYDEILEKVAPSREDRQSLLEDYFEPASEEEREQGIKSPTKAHKSIAWLIDEGYINIVVTTNFDQLLEQALSERNITPVVVSSASDLEGAAPLTHQESFILKVNGDYKETNIKNITEELEEYDKRVEDLLDQIFDEYGLIVCGWSGELDIGLRNAIIRSKNRRYSTFWAYHGELEDKAEKIISHQNGRKIPISGAENFFSELKEKVQALESAESGAPLTREIARERVKRYMSKESRKIELSDLLTEEIEKVRKKIFDEERFPLDIEFNKENLNGRLDKYENVIGTLSWATSACAYWGPEVPNSGVKPLSKTITRLGSTPRPNTYKRPWKALRLYPATFLLYLIGVASVESENWELIHNLLNKTQIDPHEFSTNSTVKILNPIRYGSNVLSGRGNGNQKIRQEMKKRLHEPLKDFLPDKDRYQYSFHKFEIIADLAYLNRYNKKERKNFGLYGNLYYKSQVEEIKEKVNEKEENWGPIQAGLFNGSLERLQSLIEDLREKIQF